MYRLHLPSASPIPPEQAVWVKTILNKCEGESLRIDKLREPLLDLAVRGAIKRFQQRYGLAATGILDIRTLVALTQRAINVIRNLQMPHLRLPINGIVDDRTTTEIKRFQSSELLRQDGIINRNTMVAMINALNSRRVRSGDEPVGVQPWARGYAIEDHHLRKLFWMGWKRLPNWFPRIDAVKGGREERRFTSLGKQVREIIGADFLSIKSTYITDPQELATTRIREWLNPLRGNNYSNRSGTVIVRNVKAKNLHLIFEQGFLRHVLGNKNVVAALKMMEQIAAKEGVRFEWFVIPSNGQIIRGPDFMRAQKTIS
jgi:Putative peptidoglycan binding domain